MKKYTSLVLLLSFLSILWAQGETPPQEEEVQEELETYEQGYADGKVDSEMLDQEWVALFSFTSTCIGGSIGCLYALIVSNNYDDDFGKRLIFSCVGSSFCGSFGGGTVWIVVRGLGDAPKVIPIGKTAEYTRGYVEGYKDATRSKKSRTALLGWLKAIIFVGILDYWVIAETESCYQ